MGQEASNERAASPPPQVAAAPSAPPFASVVDEAPPPYTEIGRSASVSGLPGGHNSGDLRRSASLPQRARPANPPPRPPPRRNPPGPSPRTSAPARSRYHSQRRGAENEWMPLDPGIGQPRRQRRRQPPASAEAVEQARSRLKKFVKDVSFIACSS